MLDWLTSLNNYLDNFPVNAVADWVSLVALTTTIVGFTATVIGVFLSKGAADAARESAREAVRGMRFIQAVATLQEICNRSRDVSRLMRDKNISGAVVAAFELREAVARFQSPASSTFDHATWGMVEDEIRTIHERLESAALTKRQDQHEREALIHGMGRVHSALSTLAARTTFIGDKNADS